MPAFETAGSPAWTLLRLFVPALWWGQPSLAFQKEKSCSLVFIFGITMIAMQRELTSGACRVCGRLLGKLQATNHIKACWKQRLAAASSKAARRWFHLVIEGRHSPEYWMHLQAPANGTFGDLDGVLRAIWLECCDHMSGFEFPVKRPPRGRGSPLDMRAMLDAMIQQDRTWDDDDDDQLMGDALSGKLQPGAVFSYKYDYGSTTDLKLRVAGEYAAPALKGGIKLLARNEPPHIPCVVCQKPATKLCQDCGYGTDAAFCDICVRKHKCDPEMLVPVVNSPRTGVCAYCGPSKEP